MTIQLWCNPLAFCFPFSNFLFCLPSISLYLLGTLLAVIGSRPPRSQVARKLISPFPPLPHSKIPTPWGFPELNTRRTKTTSQIWLTRSRTIFKVTLMKKTCYLSFKDYIHILWQELTLESTCSAKQLKDRIVSNSVHIFETQ